MQNGVSIHDLNGVEALTSQLPLVGYTVFWRLTGIRVSHLDLEQALQATGFKKYLPDPPTPRVALRRALAEWIKAKQQIARSLQTQKPSAQKSLEAKENKSCRQGVELEVGDPSAGRGGWMGFSPRSSCQFHRA